MDPEVLQVAIAELKERCGDDKEAFRKALPHVIEQWKKGGPPPKEAEG